MGKEDRLKKLLFLKKEFKKIKKELENEDSIIPTSELMERYKVIETKMVEAEYAMVDINKGMYLGIGYKLGRDYNPQAEAVYAKWKGLNNHVGFKGTTRVGKTQNMLWHIEQCIAKGYDVIVIDPKGGEKQEVLSSVAESCFKYSRSEEIIYISPAFENLSQKINVLYGKTNIEIASDIVQSIADPTMESFYLDTITRILLAITTSFEYLQIVSDPSGKITESIETQELKNYVNFINQRVNESDETYGLSHRSDIYDKLLTHQASQVELDELMNIGFNRTLITFRDLELYCSYEGLQYLEKLITSIPLIENTQYTNQKMYKLRDDSIRALRSALKTDPQHFAKVSDTLGNRLLQLSIGPIGEMLCGTRINPLANRLMREDKGVVAVIQPFPMKFKKSAEMFNKIFLGMLDSMMGTVAAEGRPLPRRIALFIDEAGIIVYPGIQNFFNRAGGLGISCFVYTQTDEDYKLGTTNSISDVILSNINTIGIMRQPLYKSAEEVSDSIGTIYVHKTVAMVSSGGGDGRYSNDIKEEKLATAKDIKQLPVGEGILTHDGVDYYMEFPYRKAPIGSFKMPELATEKSKRFLVDYEVKLEKLILNERTVQDELDSYYSELEKVPSEGIKYNV